MLKHTISIDESFAVESIIASCLSGDDVKTLTMVFNPTTSFTTYHVSVQGRDVSQSFTRIDKAIEYYNSIDI